MSKYVIEDTTLTAIADAVREKAGTEDLILVSELPTAIANIPTGGGGGEELPEEAFIITGNCMYKFAYNSWNWFLENYGDRITTVDINGTSYMFYNSTELTEIPFDINLKNATGQNMTNMFYGCSALKEAPLIKGELPKPTGPYTGVVDTSYFFGGCRSLRNIPDDYFHNFGGDAFWEASKQFSTSRGNMFNNCHSLRKAPDLSIIINKNTSSYSHLYNSLFGYCSSLDEVIDLPIIKDQTLTSNFFQSTVTNCNRLKRFTFQTNEDGSPLVVQWKSQTLDLTQNVGYVSGYPTNVLNYNSGITSDKQVNDDATYQALKNDPDWFTTMISYSRYNHDSAVETINSLPDTSAYLAANGGTNTIKFKGAAGSATDGGAINTLTEEEIAVATTKGWTVTFK